MEDATGNTQGGASEFRDYLRKRFPSAEGISGASEDVGEGSSKLKPMTRLNISHLYDDLFPRSAPGFGLHTASAATVEPALKPKKPTLKGKEKATNIGSEGAAWSDLLTTTHQFDDLCMPDLLEDIDMAKGMMSASGDFNERHLISDYFGMDKDLPLFTMVTMDLEELENERRVAQKRLDRATAELKEMEHQISSMVGPCNTKFI